MAPVGTGAKLTYKWSCCHAVTVQGPCRQPWLCAAKRVEGLQSTQNKVNVRLMKLHCYEQHRGYKKAIGEASETADAIQPICHTSAFNRPVL